MAELLDHEKHLIPSTPEAEGIPSAAIRKFIGDCLAAGSDLHGVLLVRHGRAAFSAFFDPYRPEDKRHVYSVSKSWTATAVGLAAAEGKLSLTDKVVSFFPEDCPDKISGNLAGMEVRHLLSMSCGHETEPKAPDGGMTWVQAFLRHPVPFQPGTHFLYNSMGSYMLSAILQKATGEKAVDYLKPRLFEPLGITGVTWDCSPEGICCGGWGIHVSAEDVAKLGMVYLNGGVFEGRRILSAEWVREATSMQIDNSPNVQKDWEQGYCYQIWRCQHNCFRFDGAYGQYMAAMPEKDAVLVVFSSTACMQVVLDSLWENLLPAMGDAPLPEDAEGFPEYRCRLPELEGRDFAADYSCGENEEDFRALSVRTGQNGGELRIETAGGELTIPFARNRWQRAALRTENGHLEGLYGIAGGWDGGGLTVILRHLESPHTYQFRLRTSAPASLTVTFRESDGEVRIPLS